MGRHRQITAAWLLDRIGNVVIDLPRLPEATTDVIPFEKPESEDDRQKLVGSSVHVLYEVEDEETGKKKYEFYKGEIVRALKGDRYRLEFEDGDVMEEVDFCDPGETFLWHTGDVTRGGRWRLKDRKEVQDEEIDIGGEEETNIPQVTVEPGGLVKAEDVEKADTKEVEAKIGTDVGDATRSPPNAVIRGAPKAVPSASKKGDRPVNQSGAFHSPPDPSLGRQPQTKKAATVPAREQPRQKMDETTELRASIQSAGKEFINALRALQTAASNLGTLNTSLKTYVLRGDVSPEQLTVVAKGARGLMNHLLRPIAEFRNANDMGLEKVWPVNDLVMKPVSMLFNTTGSLCQKAKFPSSVDGGVLETWRRSKQSASTPLESRPDVPSSRNRDDTHAAENDRKRGREQETSGMAEATPSSRGNTDVPSMPRDATPLRQPKVGRRDVDIFPSTGSKVRDDALKILAHSLTSSVATPYELAVDIEAAVHKKFPPSDQGTFPDGYYSSVMGARDVLNADSDQCRHILRMMVLEGFLSPEDFVSNSTEELEAQLEAFRTKIR